MRPFGAWAQPEADLVHLSGKTLRTCRDRPWKDFPKEVKPASDQGRYAATYVVCWFFFFPRRSSCLTLCGHTCRGLLWTNYTVSWKALQSWPYRRGEPRSLKSGEGSEQMPRHYTYWDHLVGGGSQLSGWPVCRGKHNRPSRLLLWDTRTWSLHMLLVKA